MVTFIANIRRASAISDDTLTAASVGVPVKLNLAEDFDGLAKTVVFRAGAVSVDVALVGDESESTIPPEVLATAGKMLEIGVYAANNGGDIIIPTVWATVGMVTQGVSISGVDPASPTPSWVAQVQNMASSAVETANGVKAQADAGDFDGQDGADGQDGFSPVVSVSEITGGHRVFVTDGSGTTAFDVMDGADGATGPVGPAGADGQDGAPGTNGADGQDGYSPTVTVTDITGGHRVTITDIDGDHIFDVMDGTGGSGGAVTSVNGETGDVVLDAEDVGAYALPSGGIPKTDLASAVQTSLGKADTALQSAPVTSVNTKTGAVLLSASDVGAYALPSGGIPSTDMANAVQTSLGKANTAYQKPSGGIPAADLANGVIPSVPSAYTSDPADLGTKSPGSSTAWARGDHVHAKPTYSKSDIGLGNVDNVQQYSADNPPPYPVTSVNNQTGAVSLTIPSTASDVGAVAVAQGVGHAGEFLVVGSDGNVTTVTLATWQGGSY